MTMSSWSHIILEAYCMFSSMSKKQWKTYAYKDKPLEGKPTIKTIKNENYIPKKERPNWCKKQNKERTPQYRCLSCPFFAYTNAEKKDYKQLFKKYK